MEIEKNCYESKHREQQFRHFHIHKYLNSKGTEIYSFRYTQLPDSQSITIIPRHRWRNISSETVNYLTRAPWL